MKTEQKWLLNREKTKEENLKWLSSEFGEPMRKAPRKIRKFISSSFLIWETTEGILLFQNDGDYHYTSLYILLDPKTLEKKILKYQEARRIMGLQ